MVEVVADKFRDGHKNSNGRLTTHHTPQVPESEIVELSQFSAMTGES